MTPKNWTQTVREPGRAEWTHDQTGVRVVADQLHAWWHVKVVEPDSDTRIESCSFEQSPRAAERRARNIMAKNPGGTGRQPPVEETA